MTKILSMPSWKFHSARAKFENYLGDLNKQELVNLIDREVKLEHYPGLKVGDIYAPNNNAGNWE